MLMTPYELVGLGEAFEGIKGLYYSIKYAGSTFVKQSAKKMVTSTVDDVANVSNRAFFSGSGSELRAINEGFQTLGQTRAGQNLAQLTRGMPYYQGSQAYNMWGRLSATYAKGIPNGSTVNVFLNNPSVSGIWNTIERPILEQKNITLIFK